MVDKQKTDIQSSAAYFILWCFHSIIYEMPGIPFIFSINFQVTIDFSAF